MEHVGKEIANYLRANKITQEEVAGAFGVSQAYISALLSGKKAFGKKTAELWHNHFGFNRTFLLTGEGDLMDVEITRMDHPKSSEKLGDAEVPLYDIDAAANLRTRQDGEHPGDDINPEYSVVRRGCVRSRG